MGESSKAKDLDAIKKLVCQKCEKDILDDKYHQCDICEVIKHDACLSVIEIKSYKEDKKTLWCENCIYELASKSFSEEKEQESENESDSDKSSDGDDEDEDDPRDNYVTRRSNKTGTTDQNNFFQKLSVRKLPIVTDSDVSWRVFYDAYTETRNLFSDQQNVVRIQEAIKDETVKRIGGKNIFNPKTYHKSLQNINKRLKNNFSALYKEASDLESHSPIKSHQKVKAVEFIDKLRNFDILAKAYKEQSYTQNKKFLANIANVLPNFLKVAWEKKQAKLERLHEKVTLSKLVKVLDSHIPTLELSIRNDSFANNKKETNEHKKKNEKFRLNHIGSDRQSYKSSSSYKCWFHKNDSHPFNKCKDLWRLDGRAVTDIAKKNGICTYCGVEWSSHKNCPNNKLKCRVEGCSYPHHSIFCFKRKVNQGDERRNESHTNNHKSKNESKKGDKKKLQTKNVSTSETDSDEEEMKKLAAEVANNHFYANIHHSNPHYIANVPHRVNINFFEHSNNSRPSREYNALLGVIVIRLNKTKEVALLVDSGSTVSLIEESIANELKIVGPKCPLTLIWSGEQKRFDDRSRIIKTEACGMSSFNEPHSLYFRTVENLRVCPQKFEANEYYAKHKYLLAMNLHDYEEIHGVIGIDNKFVFETLRMFVSRKRNSSEPFGIRCPLGDYVFGASLSLGQIYEDLMKECEITRTENRLCNVSCELTEHEQNELQIMQNEVMGFEYLNPGDTSDRKIAEEVYALEKLENETKKINNTNHYIAPLLWKDDKIELETFDSYKVSLRRYLIVEKNALKLGKFDECVIQIQNLLQKGYAKELRDDEIKITTNKTFYNPIFFIHPPNKRTRMIWDLAAKVNGKSLNDHLITGPNLYNNLLQMIFQMRERNFLFKGDLQEMFHQIFVKDDDTESLRFLFRFSQDEKIRVYKMMVLPFGAKCSPTISQFVKNLIAKSYMKKYPDPCNTIMYNSYVDDIVKSVDTLTEAKNLPVQIKRILHTGGFNMLKINSNSPEVIEHLKSSLHQNELKNEKLFANEEKEKLLGYDVNFRQDSLSINLNFNKFPQKLISGDEKPNKRQVLQVLMTIFDPVGFMQFITSKLKILYHRLCVEKYDWDQILNDDHFSMWQKCLQWLSQISSIEIPRIYCPLYENAKEVQLWAFGDSGKEIACGVLFLRFLDDKNNQIGYRLIYAKTFVTPVKQKRTIPELELNVSFKICEMVQDVKEMHSIKFDKVIYATDNAAVREWITNSPKKPTTYVKNRIDKIQQLTKSEEWIWLPTDFMVADFGTKMSSMPDISIENDWFNPRLFRLPEENWPEFHPNKVEIDQQINMHMSLKPENEDDEDDYFHPSKFKDFLSLIYAGQWILRWLHLTINSRKLEKIVELTSALNDDPHNREMKREKQKLINEYNNQRTKIFSRSFMFEHMENLCYVKAQKTAYKNEWQLLKDEKTLPKNNKLYKLNPFIDKNDVIRISTRLGVNKYNVDSFGFNSLCPILLPKNHPLTSLVILRYHTNNKHALTNSVVVNLMKKYYIPHIKWIVKQTINLKCFNCRQNSARPEVPQMGNFPAVRLTHHVPAFTHAMVDLAGPIIVNVHRNVTAKRYIFVYSCLTTRAVHLELIEKMDADSTLIALSNTINLRGAPKILISDNGLNFKGAKNILDDAANNWNKKLLGRGIITSPIEWQFGPPRSPHSQGAVERMVGLTKMILKKIDEIGYKKRKMYTDFMLRAVLNETIGILNNRPLTLVPLDGTITEILTPNHFLIGRQNVQTVVSDNITKKSLNESYEDLKIITNILWNHWIKAYLPSIMLREKWFDKKAPLNVGDIVMTVDTTTANSWRLGKIVKVVIGSRNQAREYEILLGKNNILPDDKNLTKKKILDLYKNEKHSIVRRGATTVAKIDVNAIKL